jgi:hypothetical protein
MGETRVDLLHLLEDLRDAYPGALEETILTEIVANSLDSGAGQVRIQADPAHATLTVIDDGSGMQRRDLARYHDIASSTKTRGQGIGFAGVGIKPGLLSCERVHTETRRGKTHVASEWRLASRHKAPWKWVAPLDLVPSRGTAVRLHLTNALSPLLDSGYVESALRRHFEPLLTSGFPILAEHYRAGVGFEVNGRPLEIETTEASEQAPIEIRFARKRKPSAIGHLVRDPLPLAEERRGLAISTLGKVIKRGWDWVGITPATPDRIGGLIEVPALAECLTLNKADFIRTGAKGATYLAYRKAIQESVARQLAVWGDARDLADATRRRVARPVERDLERVLIDLADDFPLLASLVERRQGGQRRLPIGTGSRGTARELVAASVLAEASVSEGNGAAAFAEHGAESVNERGEAAGSGPSTSAHHETIERDALLGAGGPRKPARYGLSIQFESRERDAELGRLVESTVWVNESHPAYRRAAASRSEGYHVALTVALALAPLAVEPREEHGFVIAFLERWGRALERPGRTRRG